MTLSHRSAGHIVPVVTSTSGILNVPDFGGEDVEHRLHAGVGQRLLAQRSFLDRGRVGGRRHGGSHGGGMVTVTVSGDKQLQSIKLDPEVVSKDDVEMLQDLILAAINDAHRKVDEQLGQQMQGLMGGLKIPGF